MGSLFQIGSVEFQYIVPVFIIISSFILSEAYYSEKGCCIFAYTEDNSLRHAFGVPPPSMREARAKYSNL